MQCICSMKGLQISPCMVLFSPYSLYELVMIGKKYCMKIHYFCCLCQHLSSFCQDYVVLTLFQYIFKTSLPLTCVATILHIFKLLTTFEMLTTCLDISKNLTTRISCSSTFCHNNWTLSYVTWTIWSKLGFTSDIELHMFNFAF